MTTAGVPPPRISSTALSQITSIFGLANSRSCKIFSARKLVAAVDQGDVAGVVGQVERLLDRGIAAADHRHLLPRKKKPSQVAQAETPAPW